MNGFYGLTANDLLRKAQSEIVEFHETCSLTRLFDACCTLYHLREWICVDLDVRRMSPEWPRCPEERLAQRLWAMNEFQLVRGLCNRAKHFVITREGPDPATEAVEQAGAGQLRCGDSLGSPCFFVGTDGVANQDVRDVLAAVLRVYLDYFAVPMNR